MCDIIIHNNHYVTITVTTFRFKIIHFIVLGIPVDVRNLRGGEFQPLKILKALEGLRGIEIGQNLRGLYPLIKEGRGRG